MKPYSTFGMGAAAALVALALLGLSPNDNLMTEDSGFFVSGSDYNAVVQERAGYAFGLGHFVGQNHAIKHELEGWQDMVRELSGMSAPNTLISRLQDTTQERLGYQVVTAHLIGVNDGLHQTIKGYQAVVGIQADMNKALRQEQMGLRYMLERMTPAS